jgi:RimJ/RimL family protein N-acetyltransferase
LIVRLPEAGDVDALVEFGEDPDIVETMGCRFLTLPRPIAEQRLAEFQRGWESPSHFGPTFIVAEAKTDQMIGVVFVERREQGVVGLPYGVAREWKGRGIGSRAIKLVSRWCLEQAGFNGRVEMRVGKSNMASQRAVEKAGFERRGIVKSFVPEAQGGRTTMSSTSSLGETGGNGLDDEREDARRRA